MYNNKTVVHISYKVVSSKINIGMEVLMKMSKYRVIKLLKDRGVCRGMCVFIKGQ